MKFVAEIYNIDTQESYSLTQEGSDAKTTHKHIFMNILNNNEEIRLMQDPSGKIVYTFEGGFID